MPVASFTNLALLGSLLDPWAALSAPGTVVQSRDPDELTVCFIIGTCREIELLYIL